MSLEAGLVGLPNVGKSTLFNALTNSSIPAENYPFCTIDPHVALTNVPDDRIPRLEQIYNPKKTIPATVTFVDIAGLVKGASSGEGLGNQFLSNIHQVDLILHVLRCFTDPEIAAHQGDVDPIDSFETIFMELVFKDVETIANRKEKVERQLRKNKGDADLQAEHELLTQLESHLNEDPDPTQIRSIIENARGATVPLLSAKPFMIVANLDEQEIADEAYRNNTAFQQLIERFGEDTVIPVSAKLAYDLSQLSEDDAEEMSHMMGLKEPALNTVIQKTYDNLGLITFFTCGPSEVHAWPIQKGTHVRQAAGKIHSDLERGFICAELYSCNDIFEHQSVSSLKDAGKIRREGENYVVKDGDIIEVKFNV